jgi:membrane-bound serine protease (ClpP class)
MIRRLVIVAVVVASVSMTWAQTSPDVPAGARVREAGWFGPRRRSVVPPVLPAEVPSCVIIEIRDDIRDPSSADILSRQIIEARSFGPQVVIFDIHTPGGDRRAMEAMCDLITKELKDVYTVAFVNDEAISAGAIVSLACDEIIMVPNALIGDAMPIMIGPDGLQPIPAAERGKIESYIRADVRTLCERNGYNVAIGEGMITLTDEVWLIRNNATGELNAINVDRDIPGGDDPAPGKTVYADDTDWVYVERIDAGNELVTFTTTQAYDYGLIDRVVDDENDLLAILNLTGEPHRLTRSGVEGLSHFLSSSAVSSVLMSVGIILFLIELRSPGFGIAGSLAIACFAVLFGSRYLTGLAQWWELSVIAIGIILLILEVTVIPGFGVAGILGSLMILFGLFAILIPNAPDRLPIPTTDMDWALLGSGLLGFILAITVAAVVSIGLMRLIPKVPIARKLTLGEPIHYEAVTATDQSGFASVKEGDVGTVESMCRPVGKVRFGESLLDATATGEYVQSGRKVRVTQVCGNHLIVEPLNDEDEA